MRPTVTRHDILDGLRRLGVASGDLVFVHASLSRFGHVDGGPDALIDALLESVGPTGTLAMPGFTFQLNEESNPVFDIRRTPVWASRLYERFRNRPGTLRSAHASHSVLATGARAAALVAEHSPPPCLRPSPFGKLVDWGGKILLMGVDHNCNTTFHLVEETERLFYLSYQEAPGAVLVDETGAQRPLPTLRHKMAQPYDFNRMDALLEGAGAQTQAAIGDAIVRCVDARRMYDLAVEAVRADPEALLKRGAERVAIHVARAPQQR